MTDHLRFGVYVPTGWRRELAAAGGSQAQWKSVVNFSRLAEDLGFDSLWIADHFTTVPLPSSAPVFEAWCTSVALSQHTSSIRLGQLVSCAAYRNPALLAKMAATLDVVCAGRLELGLGAGWLEAEFEAYGFDWLSPRERVRVLEETLEVVTRMWSLEESTYEGQHRSIRQARCDPKPLQHPRPPILVGGWGERYALPVVARFADTSNFVGGLPAFIRKSQVLDSLCREIGRDPAEIVRSVSLDVRSIVTRSSLTRGDGGSAQQLTSAKDSLAGNVDHVCEQVQAYADAGAALFILSMVDAPGETTMRVFAEHVATEFA